MYSHHFNSQQSWQWNWYWTSLSVGQKKFLTVDTEPFPARPLMWQSQSFQGIVDNHSACLNSLSAWNTPAHTAVCHHSVQYIYVVRWISTARWGYISPPCPPTHTHQKVLCFVIRSMATAVELILLILLLFLLWVLFFPSCELTVRPVLNCAFLPKEKVTKTLGFL